MSMISAQIDELRRMADGQATYHDARAVMLQAADTIWELRDDLQRANAENAKLRERMAELDELLPENGRWYRAETVEAYVTEITKLRELVRDLWLTGSLCDAIPDMRLQAKGGDWRTMQERVDEALGIEVDA